MKKAIIVEDNMLISVIYRQYLKKLNYEIIGEVTKGESAIEILQEENVDVIIMDIMLDGDLDGIDTVIELRKKMDTPVIFASGNSDELKKGRINSITNSLFLVKPVSDYDFQMAVKKMEKESSSN